jgi:membrane-associated protein
MELVAYLFSFVTHLDQHLITLTQEYGGWVYSILFLIIFCETGLVVTPFLPGDSLLFIAGAVAADGALNAHWLAFLLVAAAFLGNLTNFEIGRFVGPRIFRAPDSRFFKREYLDRTHAFYERHGGKAIVLSRFLPIIRTYAPFVAGVGQMPTRRFAAYNLLGAFLWVVSLYYAGYFFAAVPLVKNNLTLLIVAIVVVSVIPAALGYWKGSRSSST